MSDSSAIFKDQALIAARSPAITFEKFGKFPAEIQHMIWSFASRQERDISVHVIEKTISAEETNNPNRPDIHIYAFRSSSPFPQMMHVCHDAREAVLKHHILAFGVEEQFHDLAQYHYATAQIYFRPECDTICPMPLWKAEQQRVFVAKMRDCKVEKVALSDYSCREVYRGEADRWGDYQTRRVAMPLTSITPKTLDWMTENIKEIILWTQTEALPLSSSLIFVDYKNCSLPITMPHRQVESCEHSMDSVTLCIDELLKAQKEQRDARKEADLNGLQHRKVLDCPQWLYDNVNSTDDWKAPTRKLKWHLSKDMQVASLANAATSFIGGYVFSLVGLFRSRPGA
ncbi:c0884c5e-7c77-4989-82a6-f9c4c95b0a0c-CDS [Sclerotinia trifoliorum]|uniref:C0884c5e-7c77-4989-82a6-f9c4c95b0a0c-CDS n=1 Tax=Sclerotinia trifoliorum TaxID=28548 RepID=A0A8H2VQD8_9HELO|nr:c0884c5e-7c77-4989-82a6-f9c4c95b0a0c-CDS [Sclerotinia trifoliorum]